jgi:hypothetical protein
MTVRDRFGDRLQLLRDAVNGTVALDTEYPSFFTQLCRFYSDKKGIQFWGIDVEEDYSILIDSLLSDGVLEAT